MFSVDKCVLCNVLLCDKIKLMVLEELIVDEFDSAING